MFISKNVALVRAKEQAGITGNDKTFDERINDLLVVSKGQVGGSDEYRPYLVAALVMHTNKSEQTLIEAAGDAKFRHVDDKMNLRPAIEGNLRLQQSLDLSLNTQVPAGWAAAPWLDSLCGCKKDGEATAATNSADTVSSEEKTGFSVLVV